MLHFFKGDAPLLFIESNNLIENLKKKGFQEKIYDGNIFEEENFFTDLSINSLFGEKILLVLKRAESLKASGIEKLLKNIEIYNLNSKEIIFIYEEKKLYDKVIKEYELKKTTIKNIEKIGKIIELNKDTENKKLISIIKDKINISENDAKQLLDIIGMDYFKLENELKKLENFLDGRPYKYEAVKNLISIDKEYNLKDMIDDFLKNKNYKHIYNYLSQNQSEINLFLYLLSDELIILLKIESLINSGYFNRNINYNNFKIIFEKFKDLFMTKKNIPAHPYTIFLKIIYNIGNENFLKQKIKDILYLEYLFKNGDIDYNKILAWILKFFD